MYPDAVRCVPPAVHRDGRAVLLLLRVVAVQQLLADEIPVAEMDVAVLIRVTPAPLCSRGLSSFESACGYDPPCQLRVAILALYTCSSLHLFCPDELPTVPPYDAVRLVRRGGRMVKVVTISRSENLIRGIRLPFARLSCVLVVSILVGRQVTRSQRVREVAKV